MNDGRRPIWHEPRPATRRRGRGSDWLLVGAFELAAVVEAIFRPDVAWRPLVTLIAARRGARCCSGGGATRWWPRWSASAPRWSLSVVQLVDRRRGPRPLLDDGRPDPALLPGAVGLGTRDGDRARRSSRSPSRWGCTSPSPAGPTSSAAASSCCCSSPSRRCSATAPTSGSASCAEIRNQERVGAGPRAARHRGPPRLGDRGAGAGRPARSPAPSPRRPSSDAGGDRGRGVADPGGDASDGAGAARRRRPSEYAPQPGIADLPALARDRRHARSSRSRCPVDARRARPRRSTPRVYRLAQESLTNAAPARPAAPPASRSTCVGEAGRVRLRVADDGQIDPAPAGDARASACSGWPSAPSSSAASLARRAGARGRLDRRRRAAAWRRRHEHPGGRRRRPGPGPHRAGR